MIFLVLSEEALSAFGKYLPHIFNVLTATSAVPPHCHSTEHLSDWMGNFYFIAKFALGALSELNELQHTSDPSLFTCYNLETW